MKFIIDISEETYNAVIGDEWIDSEYINNVIRSIQNGTPLPEGHGKLIDADELSKRLVNSSMFYRGETADMFDTRFADGLREADIKLSEAPVVIEADKGETE